MLGLPRGGDAVDQSPIVSLTIGILGGGVSGSVCVALINQLFTRERTRAEAKKLAAEAEEAAARAEEVRSRTTQTMAEANLLERGETGPQAPLPTGWRKWGDDASAYEMGCDAGTVHNGKRSGYVKWRRPNAGFGTMMQVIRADNCRGRRLRLSAYAKTREVEKWAGIWMRIDGPKSELLGFDNMQRRPIQGTTEWAKYEVVLDVPEESAQIAFGFLLEGRGQVWCTDMALETVSQSVPTTDLAPEEASMSPVNLDFSV